MMFYDNFKIRSSYIIFRPCKWDCHITSFYHDYKLIGHFESFEANAEADGELLHARV